MLHFVYANAHICVRGHSRPAKQNTMVCLYMLGNYISIATAYVANNMSAIYFQQELILQIIGVLWISNEMTNIGDMISSPSLISYKNLGVIWGGFDNAIPSSLNNLLIVTMGICITNLNKGPFTHRVCSYTYYTGYYCYSNRNYEMVLNWRVFRHTTTALMAPDGLENVPNLLLDISFQ